MLSSSSPHACELKQTEVWRPIGMMTHSTARPSWSSRSSFCVPAESDRLSAVTFPARSGAHAARSWRCVLTLTWREFSCRPTGDSATGSSRHQFWWCCQKLNDTFGLFHSSSGLHRRGGDGGDGVYGEAAMWCTALGH